MRRKSSLGFATVLLFVILAAQSSSWAVEDAPCKFGASSAVGHSDGVTVSAVHLLEGSEEAEVYLFVPDGEGPMPGIIFSHSEIHGPQSRTDLRRFAFALGRAGAASIVFEGTIEWLRPGDDFKKPTPHAMACAGTWLSSHVNLDRHRLAVAGTLNGWGNGDTAMCIFEALWKAPCWHPAAVLNFGTMAQADFDNTNGMLSLAGQLRMAEFAKEQLRLADVKPEWLTEHQE